MMRPGNANTDNFQHLKKLHMNVYSSLCTHVGLRGHHVHAHQLLEHMEGERGPLLLTLPQTTAVLTLRIFGSALVI